MVDRNQDRLRGFRRLLWILALVFSLFSSSASFALTKDDVISMSNQNVGEARIKGAEFVWEQGAFEVLRWYLQATYLHTEGDDGDRLLRRPQYSLGWTLNGDIGEDWSGDTTILWVHSRDDVDPLTYERVENKSYYTVNMSVAWKPWAKTAINARILNVFDQDYQEVSGYPAPGRRFMAGLQWDF